MNSFQVFGIKSKRKIQLKDNVFEILKLSVENRGFKFKDGDILIITSKIISLEQQSVVRKDEIKTSSEADKLSQLTKMDPSFVQTVLDQPDVEVVGYVHKALLTITPYGSIPNGGVDQSNSPPGWYVLLPRNIDEFANEFRNRILIEFSKDVSIIIADSTITPLRQGTSGIALAVSGINPVIDDRGKQDLFGYKNQITTRALADNIVTAANILMGETDEMIPFAVVRGLKFLNKSESKNDFLISKDQCLFFGPYLRLKEEDQRRKEN